MLIQLRSRIVKPELAGPRLQRLVGATEQEAGGPGGYERLPSAFANPGQDIMIQSISLNALQRQACQNGRISTSAPSEMVSVIRL